MSTEFDAAIVGAGPAGLAAGIMLARHGLRVLVCDQRKFPIDKPCGEGVLPHGVRHLIALDAARHLDPVEMHSFAGIQLRTLQGAIATLPFSRGVGWGIRRRNLSQALVQTASRWPNLELQEATTVQQLNATPDGTELRLRGCKVKARLLIGADGLGSRVRRWAGLEGKRRRLRRLGIRQHFHIAPWNQYVEVHCGRGIEAYVTPCGKEQIGVAVLWDSLRHRRVPARPIAMTSFLQHFPELDARLRGAVVCTTPQGRGPFHRVARGRCADGVILLGDAGGYLDACSGEGISLALGQALALETTVVPVLQQHRGKPLQNQLASFSRECRRITRSYYLATRLLLLLHRHPVFFDWFVRRLQGHPRFLHYLWSAAIEGTGFWPKWPGHTFHQNSGTGQLWRGGGVGADSQGWG